MEQLELEAAPAEWGRHFLPRELAALFYGAGWSDSQKLLDAISVCIAESNGYEHRKHENFDETGKLVSTDRGLWMLNDVAHPDVSDAVAYDAAKATVVARKIYVGRGYTFKAWSAYNNGSYKDPNKNAMKYAFDGIANFLRVKNGYPL